ncbi:unnamed protein product [Anisakis simplex]|uniref:G_PROTEIN_RECEP_F1_2 domain-containing protein n=1 Tax=Anisakis simplex TaxID=6269 RepID=A0A0M3KJG1_ANISI|nr:unnamed protein product [Anisakis simplex]
MSKTSDKKIVVHFLGLVLKLIPCLMLTIFMTLLVRMLMEARERRTRLCGGSATGKSQAERTTSMLTAIVAVFLITEAPQGLLVFATGVKPGVRYAMQYLGDFIDLLSLINSSFNFILCALMSHVFRLFLFITRLLLSLRVSTLSNDFYHYLNGELIFANVLNDYEAIYHRW